VNSDGAEGTSPGEARKDRKCPICGKLAIEEHLPFCSKRCAQVDLNRWLSGVYAIPGARQSDGDEGENGD
jgi:uncharacterized protein